MTRKLPHAFSRTIDDIRHESAGERRGGFETHDGKSSAGEASSSGRENQARSGLSDGHMGGEVRRIVERFALYAAAGGLVTRPGLNARIVRHALSGMLQHLARLYGRRLTGEQGRAMADAFMLDVRAPDGGMTARDASLLAETAAAVFVARLEREAGE